MEPPPSDSAEPVDVRVATAALIASSIFELVAAALSDGSNGAMHAYAVAVGAVSLLLVAPVALVLFAEPLADARGGIEHLARALNHSPHNSQRHPFCVIRDRTEDSRESEIDSL